MALAVCLLCAGCMSFNRNGTTHHVIIGFGIVSVNNTNNAAATVIKSQAIGLNLSDGAGTKLGLGYSSTTVVKVHTNENVIIEVYDMPGKPLTVNIPK